MSKVIGKDFFKRDLKSGMKVTLRNGYEYIIFLGTEGNFSFGECIHADMVRYDCCGYMKLDDYSQSLTCGTMVNTDLVNYDIVKVSRAGFFISQIFTKPKNVVWETVAERVEVKKVTRKELEELVGGPFIVVDEEGK